MYVLTGSSTLLGFIAIMSLGPTLLVAPVAGVMIDRLNKRNVIVVTQSVALLQAAILATLVLTHRAQIWHIVALALLMGVVTAVDNPGRQAFMIEIVEDREHLPNAIALNSSMFNLARIAGPMLAGWVLKVVGAGMCFLLNAVSFVAVIIALLAMKIAPRERKVVERHVGKELKEGAAHAFGSVPMRSILLFLSLMSFCSGAYTVLLPAFAKSVFKGNETTYTVLYAAVGCGAVAAAITMASRRSVRGLSRKLLVACLIFSSCLTLIGASSMLLPRIGWESLHLPAVAVGFWRLPAANLSAGYLCAIPLLIGVGFGAMTHMASSNTMIQTIADDEYRGRVMSFYTMAFMTPMPIGSMLAGTLADLAGPPKVILLFGLLGVMGALIFRRGLPTIRAALRPIYEEKGIIPGK